MIECQCSRDPRANRCAVAAIHVMVDGPYTAGILDGEPFCNLSSPVSTPVVDHNHAMRDANRRRHLQEVGHGSGEVPLFLIGRHNDAKTLAPHLTDGDRGGR